MAGLSGSAPRPGKPIPGATLSLFAVAFLELRRDLSRLVASRWDEPMRRRAEELSTALAQACQRQGLQDLGPLFRALANLTRVSRADAIPILPALKEKFESLTRDVESLLPKRMDRSRG
jgi:hypothetical protein